MINIGNVSEAIAREIKLLSEKIENDLAHKEDYIRYKTLLNESGIGDDLIKNKLSKYDIDNVEDYYKKRRENRDDSFFEGAVLGVLLGLGLSILFLWALQQEKTSKNK